jgi:DNA-binding transcriptional regulator WhiA
LKLKIDTYTQYETIKIGRNFRVHVHSLTNTDVLVARDIVAATTFAIARTIEAETTLLMPHSPKNTQCQANTFRAMIAMATSRKF